MFFFLFGWNYIFFYFVEILLTVPPGFDRGLTFGKNGVTLSNEDGKIEKEIKNESPNVINLMEIVQKEQDLLGKLNLILQI